MGYTIEAGATGKALDLSCDSFAWLATCLDLPMDAEAWLPSQVAAHVQRFYQYCGGNASGTVYFNDAATCDRIMEFLIPVKHPVLSIVVDALGIADVQDANAIDYTNLGKLNDLDSPANQLWDKLTDYIWNVGSLARLAKSQGEIVRIY